MTVSGGRHRRGDTADGILARADVALYRAKELGRDRVETGGSVGFGAAATWDWTAQGGAEAANAAVAASPRIEGDYGLRCWSRNFSMAS